MNSRNAKQGFTLIELMIVVAIIAILALVGYPTYLDQVRKAARKEAAGKVLDTAGRMERIRSQKFEYQAVSDQTTDRYTITVDASDPTKFTVTATPTGDQTSDDCGTMEYTNAGVWTFTKGGSTLSQSDCL